MLDQFLKIEISNSLLSKNKKQTKVLNQIRKFKVSPDQFMKHILHKSIENYRKLSREEFKTLFKLSWNFINRIMLLVIVVNAPKRVDLLITSLTLLLFSLQEMKLIRFSLPRQFWISMRIWDLNLPSTILSKTQIL